MKRRLLAALGGLMLLLQGCMLQFPWRTAAGTDPTGTMVVYRLVTDPASDELTGLEICPVPADAGSDVEAAVELFAAPSETEELVCALPEGVTVESWTTENGVVTLTLSEDFLEAESMDRTAAAFCAALTLCSLESVESVNVVSGGQTLFAGLVPADALLRDTDTDPFVRQLRLYFADGAGRYLVSEYHSLTLDEDAAADRYVMEELLRGPYSTDLARTVPEGTELLSCQTEDGVCTVDLSAAFYEDRPGTALGERLALYSIVNSLTALSQVDSVRILVEGEPVDTYVYRSLAEPLSWYERAISPAVVSREELDVDLYLPLPGLRAIAPLPWQVETEGYASAPEAVLAALLSAAEPGFPALFPGSGTVGGVRFWGDICEVTLSESFFASLPVEARPVALQSIAASICSLDEVNRVSFTIAGGPAVFDGVDWSGPWEEFDLAE